jgi:hypothetical protein
VYVFACFSLGSTTKQAWRVEGWKGLISPNRNFTVHQNKNVLKIVNFLIAWGSSWLQWSPLEAVPGVYNDNIMCVLLLRIPSAYINSRSVRNIFIGQHKSTAVVTHSFRMIPKNCSFRTPWCYGLDLHRRIQHRSIRTIFTDKQVRTRVRSHRWPSYQERVSPQIFFFFNDI